MTKGRVLWSDRMLKINKHGKVQSRRIVLTERYFFNYGGLSASELPGVLGYCFRGLEMGKDFFYDKPKRKIDLRKITHVTYSESCNEFILHVPTDYDYQLCSVK